MALKSDRSYIDTRIDFFSDAVMERGGVLTLKTGGSGAAMDQAEAVVEYRANPSGYRPVGILIQDVVNKDLSQTHLNYYKDEVQLGGKVAMVTKGVVVTDMIYPGETITAGKMAFLSGSGMLTSVSRAPAENTPVVGVFLSSKDEDGFAKVDINLPTGQVLTWA